MECHLLRPVHEEGSYPFDCQTLNAIRPLQSWQQDIMIDTVERGTEIEKSEQRYFLFVHGVEKVRDDPEQRCLSWMISPIRRLFNWHQIVLLQVTDKPARYQSLNHLRDKGEVGDRPVVLHVRRIEMWFLDQWRDNGMPLRNWKRSLRETIYLVGWCSTTVPVKKTVGVGDSRR